MLFCFVRKRGPCTKEPMQECASSIPRRRPVLMIRVEIPIQLKSHGTQRTLLINRLVVWREGDTHIMLNTVMALWNQNPGENRQKVVKLLFTFLFISVSIFLLLFTLNSSAWISVTGKEQIQTEKGGQVGMSNHSRIATAGNTPASYGVVTGITPAATRTSIQACVHTPTVVVPPRVTPQKVVIYARSSDLEHKSSKPRSGRPMDVHVRKSKHHLR